MHLLIIFFFRVRFFFYYLHWSLRDPNHTIIFLLFLDSNHDLNTQLEMIFHLVIVTDGIQYHFLLICYCF